jgi:hypothetical protein
MSPSRQDAFLSAWVSRPDVGYGLRSRHPSSARSIRLTKAARNAAPGDHLVERTVNAVVPGTRVGAFAGDRRVRETRKRRRPFSQFEEACSKTVRQLRCSSISSTPRGRTPGSLLLQPARLRDERGRRAVERRSRSGVVLSTPRRRPGHYRGTMVGDNGGPGGRSSGGSRTATK